MRLFNLNMKVTEDRRSKAGTLSLALERYENSPLFQYATDAVEPEFEEIKKYERRTEGVRQVRARSKDKLQPKILQQESEEDLLALCSSLTSRIETLKQEKYEHVVREFEEEERRKMEALLESEAKSISEKYALMRKELAATHEAEKAKITKALEDTKKFRGVYKTMFDQLQERKTKLEREWRLAVSKAEQQRQRLAGEWKRSSNEQLLRLSRGDMHL